MSEPYTPDFTAALLAGMSNEQLARVTPRKFRMWPTRHPLPEREGADLIAQERAKRAHGKRTAGE